MGAASPEEKIKTSDAIFRLEFRFAFPSTAINRHTFGCKWVRSCKAMQIRMPLHIRLNGRTYVGSRAERERLHLSGDWHVPTSNSQTTIYQLPNDQQPMAKSMANRLGHSCDKQPSKCPVCELLWMNFARSWNWHVVAAARYCCCVWGVAVIVYDCPRAG